MISLIATMDEKRGIGKNNQLLFRIPEDLQRFRKLTLNHPIIMGRKTYESIGRPLPNRTNIVITKDTNFHVAGCIVTHSMEEAMTKAGEHDKEEIFVIGGGQIYEQALPVADKLYLTVVKGAFDADTFFPDYPAFQKIVFQQAGQYLQYSYTFCCLTK